MAKRREMTMEQDLTEALFKAHDAIKEKAKTDLNLMGMGTTMIQVVVKGNTAHICHIGDSRAYLLQDGIMQITKDQTVGNYLVKHKIMGQEEVPPQKWHTLTQAVGVSENLVPDINRIDLRDRDFLLLCSDGLTDMLNEEEILDIVMKHRSKPDKAVDTLIKKAGGTISLWCW